MINKITSHLGFHFALLLAVSFLAGCATQVQVMPIDHAPAFPHAASNQINRPWWAEDSSSRTAVQRYQLARLMSDDPERGLTEFKAIAERTRHLEDVAVLADLTLRYGNHLEHAMPQKALGWFLESASIGYHQLVADHDPMATNRWNVRLRESYNQATAGVVMLLQKMPGGIHEVHVVTALGAAFKIEAQSGDPARDLLNYDLWLPADQWKQTGFKTRYQDDGFGARLIASRTNRFTQPIEQHQPDEGIFDPATALLTFQSTGEDSGNQEMVSLLFYNPLSTPVMDMNGNKWSLAADFTMPLAMLASHTQPLFRTRWTALLNPGKTARPKRLYLMEPYSPDRIPIIMVHGLRSTPLAWAQLTNELMGDPEIRRHYQIWHYLYPTGLPLVASAADFRDELESVRTLLDPEGRDFAMQNMVVIGHSMGGLLARTLVTDSGDAIWNSTFAMPMSGLPPGLDQTPALHRLFYFQAKPYVKRVIFVAVPHHGSEVADSLLARLLARQVELPSALQDFVAHLQTSMPQLFKADDSARFDRGYHNGIRTLSPKDDSLMAMAKLPVNSSIPFHSIMGDRGRGGGAKSSDGIVTYASAHLPGASSELIVPSNHSTYENPQALAEVKRILKLHLAQSR